MKNSFRARSARYAGKEYGISVLVVDDGDRTVEIQAEKGVFGKKMRTVANLGVIAETPEASGSTLSIGGAMIDLLSETEAKTVVEMLYVPQVGKALDYANAAAEAFLSARANALKPLISLRSDPRTALLLAFNEPPKDSDPVEALVSGSSDSLKKGVEEFRTKVEAESKDLPQPIKAKVYAVVYATGRAQNSWLGGDENLLQQALGLVAAASPGSYPSASDLAGMNIEEGTKVLLRSAFSGLRPIGKQSLRQIH